MSTNTPASIHDNPPKRPLIALIPAALILGMAVWGCAKHGEPESHVWITALFVAPFALQVIGLLTLRHKHISTFWWFNCLATFLCQGSYCLLWIMYSTSWKTSEALSYFALA